LSRGGHLTLIKCMLSNLSTYFLPLFSITTDIARRLERLQRGFIWDGPNNEYEFHMVNWKAICSSVPEGGLGVKVSCLINL
jgi:hypothetical protein